MINNTNPYLPAYQQNDTTTVGGGLLVPDKAFAQLIHEIALVSNVLSVICSVVVLLTLVVLPQYRRPRIWIMIAGIALGDVLFSFHHGLDHALSLGDLYSWPAEGPMWLWLAVGTMCGYWYQSAWILSMAASFLYEFLQDMSEKPKGIPMKVIFSFTCAMGLLPWIIGLSVGVMGRGWAIQPTWCFLNSQYPISYLFLFSLWVIVFNLVLIISYIIVAVRIKWIQLENNYSEKQTHRAIKRVLLFPLVYSFQWFFSGVLLLLRYSKVQVAPEFLVLCVFTSNGGGLWNGILYYGILIIKARKAEEKNKEKQANEKPIQPPSSA